MIRSHFLARRPPMSSVMTWSTTYNITGRPPMTIPTMTFTIQLLSLPSINAPLQSNSKPRATRPETPQNRHQERISLEGRKRHHHLRRRYAYQARIYTDPRRLNEAKTELSRTVAYISCPPLQTTSPQIPITCT
jgi:hypothetical protein